MNTAGTVVSSLLVSAAVAFGIVQFAHPEPPAQAPTSETTGRSTEVLDRLASLERSIKELAARAEAQAPAEARRPEPTMDEAKIKEAVHAWLDAHRGEVLAARDAAGTRGGAAKTPDAKAPQASFDEIWGELLKTDLPYDRRMALWAQAKEAGWIDRLVESFEKRAKDQPNNADTQVGLADAYLQKLYVAEDGPAKGVWGMKADKAFDRALEIDDRHWTARFSKAASLSFWPPVLGKQGEAISHFETLLKQQAESPSRPDFVQTYFFLGNLYEQQGKTDKAKEIRQRGLKAFPDNEDLKKLVGK